MSEEEGERQGSKPMLETIMNAGAKQIGAPPDRKKAAEHILRSYADRPETRDESIMKNFERSREEPARSIGERLEEQ